MKSRVAVITIDGRAFCDRVPNGGTADDLERLFDRWNGGSGSACAEFRRAGCRSLSVGDTVSIEGVRWRVACDGWQQLTV